MGRLARLAVAAACVVAFAQPATGKGDAPDDDVLSLLDSRDDARVAWGAWLAADRGVQAAVPRIVFHLGRIAGRGDEDRVLRVGALRHVLSDAIVRLDPAIDGRALVGSMDPFALTAFLLRHPEAQRPALVALFERLPRYLFAWQAVGEALADEPPPGLAAAVLRGMTVQLEVRVWDQVRRFRPPGGSVRGCGFSVVPWDLPPLPRYWLSRTGDASDVCLRGPPHPVYVRRTIDVGAIGWGTHSYETPDRDPDDLSAGWLDRWVGLPRDAQVRPTVDVRWRDSRHYLAAVDRAWRRPLAGWWETVRRLRRRGLLTDDEVRGLAPQLDSWVYDLREPTEGSRPPLPPLPLPDLRRPIGLAPSIAPRWAT